MLDAIVWLLSWALVAAGCLFIVAGGVGLLRLPDLYARLHGGSVTDTGGAIMISFALVLQALFSFGDPLVAAKMVMVLFFLLFTSPTASHAVAKTALLSGQVPLDAEGRPVLDSPEAARRLARSRADAADAAEAAPDAGSRR